MTRVPDHVVEKRAKEYIERFNDPRAMCLPSAVRDVMRTIAEITAWSKDFSLFTHEDFHLYPGWDQQNFAHFVSLLPLPEQIEKQHEGVFCHCCSNRCLAVSPKIMEENAEQRGFRIAMESLREKKPRLTDLNDRSYPEAARELEAEGARRFGVDWNKE